MAQVRLPEATPRLRLLFGFRPCCEGSYPDTPVFLLPQTKKKKKKKKKTFSSSSTIRLCVEVKSTLRSLVKPQQYANRVKRVGADRDGARRHRQISSMGDVNAPRTTGNEAALC